MRVKDPSARDSACAQGIESLERALEGMIAAAEARGAAAAGQLTSHRAHAAHAVITSASEVASSTSQSLLQLQSPRAAKSDIKAPVATVVRATSPPPGSFSQVGGSPTLSDDDIVERMTEPGCSSPAESNGRVQEHEEITINTAHTSPGPSPAVAVEADLLSASAPVVDQSGGISGAVVRSTPSGDAQSCSPSTSGSSGMHSAFGATSDLGDEKSSRTSTVD